MHPAWLFMAPFLILAVALARRSSGTRKATEFGFQLHRFDLPDDGTIEFAQWLHPKDSTGSISQQQVNMVISRSVKGLRMSIGTTSPFKLWRSIK